MSEKLHDDLSEEEWRTMRHFFIQSDWRNEANYPRADASPDLLAWEFLRRNPTFYSEYEALAKTTGGFCYGLMDVEHFTKKWKLAAVEYLVGQWSEFVDAPCSFASVEMMPDSVAVERLPSGGWRRMYDDQEDIVLLQFDLRLPLKQQLRNAELILASCIDEEKPAKVSNSWKKFVLYLRAYDGYKATRSYDAVADLLSREGVQHDDFDYLQGVRNWIASAEKLISGDYWKIPFQFGMEWRSRQHELWPDYEE